MSSDKAKRSYVVMERCFLLHRLLPLLMTVDHKRTQLQIRNDYEVNTPESES